VLRRPIRKQIQEGKKWACSSTFLSSWVSVVKGRMGGKKQGSFKLFSRNVSPINYPTRKEGRPHGEQFKNVVTQDDPGIKTEEKHLHPRKGRTKIQKGGKGKTDICVN